MFRSADAFLCIRTDTPRPTGLRTVVTIVANATVIVDMRGVKGLMVNKLPQWNTTHYLATLGVSMLRVNMHKPMRRTSPGNALRTTDVSTNMTHIHR